MGSSVSTPTGKGNNNNIINNNSSSISSDDNNNNSNLSESNFNNSSGDNKICSSRSESSDDNRVSSDRQESQRPSIENENFNLNHQEEEILSSAPRSNSNSNNSAIMENSENSVESVRNNDENLLNGNSAALEIAATGRMEPAETAIINKEVGEMSSSSMPDEHSENANLNEDNPVAITENRNDVNSGLGREQTYEEFREELLQKRIVRQGALNNLKNEITRLRRALAEERELTRKLRAGENVEIPKEDVATSTEIGSTDSKEVDSDSGCSCECHFRSYHPIKDNKISEGADVDDDCDGDESDKANRQRRRIRTLTGELSEVQLALQLSNADNLSLNTEIGILRKQVTSLKEVIACTKQILDVREEQVVQLKGKIREIEESLAEREMKLMSDDLRQEYDRQLTNIRNLRQLYEERARVCAAERENLLRQISIKKDELAAEVEKGKGLEERISSLKGELEASNKNMNDVKTESIEYKFENKELKDEMAVINKLFSQMLTGFNSEDSIDIDQLTVMLEENRALLNEMATKEILPEGAYLPKLLFDIVKQANNTNNNINNDNNNNNNDGDITASGDITVSEIPSSTEEKSNVLDNELEITTTAETDNQEHPKMGKLSAEKSAMFSNEVSDGTLQVEKVESASSLKERNREEGKSLKDRRGKLRRERPIERGLNAGENDGEGAVGNVVSAQEIVCNLPKVWRVLMELLSHYKTEKVKFEENGQGEDCYKSVQTPNGTKIELSVSKTYIKLKDLILEKKALQKETNKLKTLNVHLDHRLNEQEKRLSAVSLELTKTWHLVGKMQRQHRQLHTHEQILRYQLQQKRRLLNELKEELEYCRKKWAAARAKNDESQVQCNDLRREFAKRKLEDLHNSAESGYSDGPASEDEDSIGSEENKMREERKIKIAEFFDKPRKPERTHSASPARNFDATDESDQKDYLLRRRSAPPATIFLTEIEHTIDEIVSTSETLPTVAASSIVSSELANATTTVSQPPSKVGPSNTGAIPKQNSSEVRLSRAVKKERPTRKDGEESLEEMFLRLSGMSEENISSDNGASNEDVSEGFMVVDRKERIQRLEDQCKSLIAQVMETSDCREKLQRQLSKFQDEMVPLPKEISVKEIIGTESEKPNTDSNQGDVVDILPGTSVALIPAEIKEIEKDSNRLTAKAEEYAARRDERLKHLEEESKLLISRIKRTSDKSKTMKTRLDKIHSRCINSRESRESSAEGITSSDETDTTESRENMPTRLSVVRETNSNGSNSSTETPVKLTQEEEAYTERRAKRLERLEQESKELLLKLNRNTNRGSEMTTKLDELHSKYKSEEESDTAVNITTVASSKIPEIKVNDIKFENERKDVKQTDISFPELTLETTEVDNVAIVLPSNSTNGNNVNNDLSTNLPSPLDTVLKRLEEEGDRLLAKFLHNADRGNEMVARLDEIHNRMVTESLQNIPPLEASSSTETESSESAKEIGQRLVTYSKSYEANMKRYEERLKRLQESKRLLSRLSESSNSESETVYYPRSRNNTDKSEKSDDECYYTPAASTSSDSFNLKSASIDVKRESHSTIKCENESNLTTTNINDDEQNNNTNRSVGSVTHEEALEDQEEFHGSENSSTERENSSSSIRPSIDNPSNHESNVSEQSNSRSPDENANETTQSEETERST